VRNRAIVHLRGSIFSRKGRWSGCCALGKQRRSSRDWAKQRLQRAGGGLCAAVGGVASLGVDGWQRTNSISVGWLVGNGVRES
jgi:hypothetical protein